VGIPMIKAGLRAPVLAFLPDDDIFPFEDLGLLFGKAGWLARQDRHVGVELVNSDEQRWIISRLVQAEPAKRPWWQLGRTVEPAWEIEVEPLEPQSFAETRARVERQASLIFEAGDEALLAIGEAGTMADLCKACFEITVWAQGCRILAGDDTIAIRSATDVADRALILFALVRISVDTPRLKTMEWLDGHGLIEAMAPSQPPLFRAFRLSDQQRAEAGWYIENLSALLWALGFADMPPPDDYPDLSTIVDIVPPSADIGVDAFKAMSGLRPPYELARMAALCRTQLREAERSFEVAPSDAGQDRCEALFRRGSTLQWILNPERLEWP